jgi:hypothetical protein
VHEANGKETVHGMVPWQHTADGSGNHGMCGYHPQIESPSKPKRDAVFFGKLKEQKPKLNKQTEKSVMRYSWQRPMTWSSPTLIFLTVIKETATAFFESA